jgi:HD-like signal output (HDOD) protein
MRILFVDDEDKVLQAIRRSLFHVEQWEVETALSGAEALELLGEEKFDVIVTDMRMPRMDGAQLLAQVQATHPDVVRIVLSGYAEEEAALRAVGVAHQFLAKPCLPEELAQTIKRTFELQRLLDSEHVQRLVGSIPSLPVVPAVFSKISDMLINPDVSLSAVARVVETDPALCAKLLQLVNSSFFANRYPTTEIQDAVVRLGLSTLKSLVLALTAMDQMRPHKRIKGFSPEIQAHHASLVARVTSSFYEGKQAKAHAFMAGMLHDIGKWVLASAAPELLEQALRKANEERVPFDVAERALYGATHAELGAYLLGIWGIPTVVVDAVAHHHSPANVSKTDSPFPLACALHVVDGISHGRPFEPAQLLALGCPIAVDELEKRCGEAEAAA